MSIKDYHGGQSWKEWPETLQKREKDSLEAIHQELTDEILFWKKVQFLFFYQWDRLKAYAEENNIKIMKEYLSRNKIDCIIIHNGGYVGDDLCNQMLQAAYECKEHTICRIYVLHNDFEKNFNCNH